MSLIYISILSHLSFSIFDTISVVFQVETLGKQHARLTEHGHQREKELQQTLEKLEGLDDQMRDANNGMERLLDNIAGQNPIGGDVALVKELQDEFKVSSRSTVCWKEIMAIFVCFFLLYGNFHYHVDTCI